MELLKGYHQHKAQSMTSEQENGLWGCRQDNLQIRDATRTNPA